MFDVSTCPVCKRLVDMARQNFVHAIVDRGSCKLVMKIPEDTDPQTIVVRLHEEHADEFKRMVASGSWSPT